MSCNCGGCAGEHQVIDGTNGEADYLRPLRVTELTGADITADTVQASVGGRDIPGSWFNVTSPHKTSTGTITAQAFRRANPEWTVAVPDDTTLYWVEVEIFIGAGGVTGLSAQTLYYPRLKLADTPSTVIRRGEPFYYQ